MAKMSVQDQGFTPNSANSLLPPIKKSIIPDPLATEENDPQTYPSVSDSKA